MALKIHNFWPHDPDTWFRQLESKFRICNISTSSPPPANEGPVANRRQAWHLLHGLPSDMRDHLIAKDFKDCTMMVVYALLLYSSRAGSTIAAVNTEYKVAVNAVSGGCRRKFSPHDRRPESCCRVARDAAPERPPARSRRTATFATSTLHTAIRRGSANPGACGPWETG